MTCPHDREVRGAAGLVCRLQKLTNRLLQDVVHKVAGAQWALLRRAGIESSGIKLEYFLHEKIESAINQ
jgi:hypothetical protein